ncbi:MAG: invasion associated locus B family protein [Alphaproteobacteria bacterium]|nr:invasion associated locus B family protein [Alphaproteobacteria bacterium]
MRGVLATLVGLAALSAPAAAEVKAIGRYQEWRVYTEAVGKDLVCFAATPAIDMAPKNVAHGEVNFFVASWKSGAAASQPSLAVGYDLRADLAPEAVIGRERFAMYAAGREAFVTDSREKPLIAALKKGSELRIEAASLKDARTAYHFSLKGSTDAIDKARALCR